MRMAQTAVDFATQFPLPSVMWWSSGAEPIRLSCAQLSDIPSITYFKKITIGSYLTSAGIASGKSLFLG